MCFKNLPIDFDAHGRPRLRDGQRESFAVGGPDDHDARQAAIRAAHLRDFDIDPVTRVAGSLSFHTVVDLQQRRVVEARTEAPTFRGYEVILKGRDPTDAIHISSRACGVCGGVHATTAAMALEMAFGIAPPPLAIIARNLGEAAELLYDHTLHLFLLAGPDYSEAVVSRTSPSLWERAQRAQAPTAQVHGQRTVADLLRGLNPLTGSLYLEALDITRAAREIATLMLGKYPHPSAIFPGGLGIDAGPDTFNQVLGRIVRLLDYAKKVAAVWDDLVEFFYAELPDYRRVGERRANFLCTGIWDDPEAYDASYASCASWGERRRSEEQRDALLERERTARAEAEAAIRARDEFVTVVSHDLRNPLTAISGQLQFLHREVTRGRAPGPEQLLARLSTIEGTVKHLAALIGDLYDATTLEAGKPLELARRPTNLIALAGEVVAAHQQLSESHPIRLEARAAELVGRWDARRLERVLANLLSNAIKYSPAGGEVLVTVSQEGGRAVLRVRDQGVGVPAHDLPHIFERYRRASNVVSRISGSGLGLAGARDIVEQHGGSISVQSVEGQGSTFVVSLPLAVAEPARESAPLLASSDASSGELEPKCPRTQVGQ